MQQYIYLWRIEKKIKQFLGLGEIFLGRVETSSGLDQSKYFLRAMEFFFSGDVGGIASGVSDENLMGALGNISKHSRN